MWQSHGIASLAIAVHGMSARLKRSLSLDDEGLEIPDRDFGFFHKLITEFLDRWDVMNTARYGSSQDRGLINLALE